MGAPVVPMCVSVGAPALPKCYFVVVACVKCDDHGMACHSTSAPKDKVPASNMLSSSSSNDPGGVKKTEID